MNKSNYIDDVLSFMDYLYLDEDVIDAKLKLLMSRKEYTQKQLVNALQLLKYKEMINKQDSAECDNEDETTFIAKLFTLLTEDNINIIAKITETVLMLNPSSIMNKSQHLLQQILVEICNISDETILKLKICDSILQTVCTNCCKISLRFLEVPLEDILISNNNLLKNHFISVTVPLLFEAVTDYHILDKIWNLIQTKETQLSFYTVLSSLSEYYLPLPDEYGFVRLETKLYFSSYFWNMIISGLSSNDSSIKKMSNYLAKRTIDVVNFNNGNVRVQQENYILFDWNINCIENKEVWENYFILIESLEEKQSNIVIPSLSLFDKVKSIGKIWINLALNVGLKHDNIQVKQICIKFRIKFNIVNTEEATSLLNALNDINLYERDSIKILYCLKDLCIEDKCLQTILLAIPLVNWSPVPFYYVSKTLQEVNVQNLNISIPVSNFRDILEVSINNALLRTVSHINFLNLFVKCCKSICVSDFLLIFNAAKTGDLQRFSKEHHVTELFTTLVMESKIQDIDLFLELILNKYTNLNIILSFLEKVGKHNKFLVEINNKIDNLAAGSNRQYCSKLEFANDFIYLTSLMTESNSKLDYLKEIIHGTIKRKQNILTQYVLSVLVDDTDLFNENLELIMEPCNKFMNCLTLNEDIKTNILIINTLINRTINHMDKNLNKKIFCIYLILALLTNKNINKKEILEIHVPDIFNIIKNAGVVKQSKLLNKLYEGTCELLYVIKTKKIKGFEKTTNDTLNFLDEVLQKGGYGCLKHIIKIMNEILIDIEKYNTPYNIAGFMDRIWKEIQEIKSNNQFVPCMREFVNLLTNTVILNDSSYNNMVVYYCKVIIDYGSVTPLWFLTDNISKLDISMDNGQIIYILFDILLFAPVPRKDQRILDNTLKLEIGNKTSQYHHFNYMVQHRAIKSLLKIKDLNIYNELIKLITKHINDTFKNKQRYHGNSYHHRILDISLQHLIFIITIEGLRDLDDDGDPLGSGDSIVKSDNSEVKCIGTSNKFVLNWCVDLIGRLPHQPSVKVYLEWLIALLYCLQDVKLNEELINTDNFKKIPQLSQFVILYQVLKFKISNEINETNETEFVLNYLLSHTMGQLFNVRLLAQYCSLNIYNMVDNPSKKYVFTMQLIEKNFLEYSSEKNYLKLKSDTFLNEFGIVSHLTPFFIYHYVPLVYNNSLEVENPIDLLPTSNECKDHIIYLYKNIYHKDVSRMTILWYSSAKEELSHVDLKIIIEEPVENLEVYGTIQKKYIPWKNMADLDLCKVEKKKANTGELIVVASLIDKLPNLGGLARTSEVFGVKTYVIDSLRHLQDKQFQGVSVSAERWVDIQEVRPGKDLKQYLQNIKADGYVVVAAEQTSSSVPLQEFKFPKKTLLLLGHEKEGIPCDLLPLMDYCIEVPQQGFIRSMNVHVTAAIFVWEYARQNIVK